jgi:hypothetical protein
MHISSVAIHRFYGMKNRKAAHMYPGIEFSPNISARRKLHFYQEKTILVFSGKTPLFDQSQ